MTNEAQVLQTRLYATQTTLDTAVAVITAVLAADDEAEPTPGTPEHDRWLERQTARGMGTDFIEGLPT